MQIAIVADDLTGALDTATPFVLRGLRVATAVRPEGLEAALQCGADVVVANTVSRALPPAAAAQRVDEVAAALARMRPAVVFKKIDSRLKGNVEAETAALARRLGYERVVVAPAIPDQGRPTVDGAVRGHGVPVPIPVAARFPNLPVMVADATSESDMDAIVAAHDWGGTLAAGARGLGAALARTLGMPTPPRPFAAEAETLIAVGSRDPITAAQIARLADERADLAVIDAPGGVLAADAPALPAVLRCSGDYGALDEEVARRFAEGVVAQGMRLGPSTLLLSGGDTALAVLDALGVALVFPEGEAAPGLPWFRLGVGEELFLRCVVKSGGFGDPGVLARLLQGAG